MCKNENIQAYTMNYDSSHYESSIFDLIIVDAITNKVHLSSEYEDLRKTFNKEESDVLADHILFDHAIETIDEKISSSRLIYDLFIIELKILRNYIKKNLAKDFIVFFESSMRTLVSFAKKSKDDLKMCVDYRRLNALTIKNRYSISLISQLLILLMRVKIFTKIDIKQVYYRLRIRNEDEWLIVFKCRYEQHEYRVMFFELINASTSFQNYINHIFKKYINVFLIIYLAIFSSFQKIWKSMSNTWDWFWKSSLSTSFMRSLKNVVFI
jgi:hypothetical protein